MKKCKTCNSINIEKEYEERSTAKLHCMLCDRSTGFISIKHSQEKDFDEILKKNWNEMN